MTATNPRRTPLHAAHLESGGRMGPFAGWDMPIRYGDGTLKEVAAVRRSAGMFDVSHMGRIEFSGANACGFLDRFLSANVAGLRAGRSRYHLICNESGGIIDDAIVYRLGKSRYLLVVNAGNFDSVREWLAGHAEHVRDLHVGVTTDRTGMIAVQGPEAVGILDRLFPLPASSVRPFRISPAEVDGVNFLLARTGYTGEDGFEVISPADRTAELWNSLLQLGVAPCGLGARDVLRLEAGLLLHGNDMTTGDNPWEAGLERFVHLDSPDYVAGEALRKVRDSGPSRRLVGFRMTGRGIARHGHPILDGGRTIGEVTSGTYSPTLDANIGMGYVETMYAGPSSTFEIDIRGRRVAAKVVPLPFYRRSA